MALVSCTVKAGMLFYLLSSCAACTFGDARAVFGKVGRLAIELLGDSPPRKIYVQFSLSATSDEERMEKCHYREEDYYN